MSNNREIAKLAKEIKEIKAQLGKTSAASLGDLEYYSVTKRGYSKFEVLIEWADGVWRSKEAYAIEEDLDDLLHKAMKDLKEKHPNLRY